MPQNLSQRTIRRVVAYTRRQWLTLTAVTFGLFMVMLDNTVVFVALPTIGRTLHMQFSQLEWVVNSYTLSLAALMLTGGKLADRFGRRRAFLLGLLVFAGSSLVCGLAPGAAWLIGARITQGAGAALMLPATLSIISATFALEERGAAIGIWAGSSAVALALGPLIGGLLTEHLGWNWIFFINVPIGLGGIVMTVLFVDESRDERTGRIDLAGVALSAAGLFALTYALIDANRYGWSSVRITALFAAATAALVVFVLVERAVARPMLDLSHFRSATFSGANLVGLLVGLSLFGVVFYISLYLQNILGYSAVRAGVAQLPYTAMIALSAPFAGRITDRLGPRLPVAAGTALLALSMVLLARLDVGTHYAALLPGMFVGGIGVGFAMGPTTVAVLSTVPVDRAGVGSGVLNTFRQTGGALGVALMGAIVAAAIAVPATTPLYAVQFCTGLRHALLVAAAIVAAGTFVALATIARGGPAPAGEVIQRPGEGVRTA